MCLSSFLFPIGPFTYKVTQLNGKICFHMLGYMGYSYWWHSCTTRWSSVRGLDSSGERPRASSPGWHIPDSWLILVKWLNLSRPPEEREGYCILACNSNLITVTDQLGRNGTTACNQRESSIHGWTFSNGVSALTFVIIIIAYRSNAWSLDSSLLYNLFNVFLCIYLYTINIWFLPYM
jgi:hypothetical protein